MKIFKNLNERQMEYVVSCIPEFTKVQITKSKAQGSATKFDVGIKDRGLFTEINSNLKRFDRSILIDQGLKR